MSPKDLEDLRNAAIKKLLDDFLKSQKETMYPEMEKNRVIQRINELVAHPWKITQGKNGTCGAAVICKYLLEKDPLFGAGARKRTNTNPTIQIQIFMIYGL